MGSPRQAYAARRTWGALRTAAGLALWAVLLGAVSGCLSPRLSPAASDSVVAAAARPILALDADAVWTEAYNRLVELGPASIDYLIRQPAMTQPAAPDDLGVLLHTSLVRLLADPAAGPPRLSASCLETTLEVLHFDLRVKSRPLGTIVVAEGSMPSAWHDLYPADFDHALAGQIDLEADRQALCDWWRTRRNHGGPLVTTGRLEPQAKYLWPLLSRRYADRWEYQPETRAVLCAAPPRGPALLEIRAADYNLVRGACIWLGSSSDPAVQAGLIDSAGSPSPVVAHNARFALGHSPDERIRRVLRRYETQATPGPGKGRQPAE
jgi:hypothetical protein